MIDQKLLFEQLEKIAQKLGVTADYLWAFLVKQQINEAIFTCIAFGISIVLFLFMLKNILKDNPFPQSKQTVIDHVRCFAFVGSGIFLMLSLLGFCVNILCFFNPEYYAFHELVKMFK